MSAERVRNYLMEHGVRYETRTHPTTYITSQVAEMEHVPGDEMAKVVMLVADDRLVMTVIPGSQKVDLEKAALVLGAEDVRLATESEFSGSFPDCEIGAEPPFGGLYEVSTVVDLSLDRPRITFNAGTHTETISMAIDDYLELTKPMRADLLIGK